MRLLTFRRRCALCGARRSHQPVFPAPPPRAVPRRRVRPRWVKPTLTLGAAGLAAAAALGAPLWLWRSGPATEAVDTIQARALAASAELGLAVGTVLVEGRKETSREAVLEAVGLSYGQPILAFHPPTAKERLEALPWIHSAAVERRLPETVILRLVERRPFALWQQGGRLALVDDEGAVIQHHRLERFADLPVVLGEDAPRHAPALLAMLAVEPELQGRVAAAVRVGGRRWNLRLDNGIDVRLPEEGAEAAWRRLAELDRRHGLLARDVIAVDLRIPGRLVMKVSPAAAQRARDPGTST